MFFSVCSSSFSVLLLSNDTGDLAVVVILGRLKGPRWDLKAVKGFRNGFLILVTPATSLGSCLAQDGSLEFRQFFVSGLSLDLCVGLFVLVCFEAGGNLSHAPPRHLLSWSLRSETKEQTIYLYKPSWVLCLIPVDNSPDLFSFFSSVAGLSPHFSPCPHSSGAAFPGPDTRHIGHQTRGMSHWSHNGTRQMLRPLTKIPRTPCHTRPTHLSRRPRAHTLRLHTRSWCWLSHRHNCSHPCNSPWRLLPAGWTAGALLLWNLAP